MVGTVIVNKNNPGLWGIRLNLDEDVIIQDKNGTQKTVLKNGVIPIIRNLEIDFGEGLKGEII